MRDIDMALGFGVLLGLFFGIAIGYTFGRIVAGWSSWLNSSRR